MILSIIIAGKTHQIDVAAPLDIAIPLRFNEAQPNVYGVEKAIGKAVEAGNLIGDTRRGGSCNFERYSLIPHCQGTHTECVGHITDTRISVHECLREAFIPANLITVAPETAAETGENYPVETNENDRMITRRAIEKALGNREILPGLIVRTLPNGEEKSAKTYLTDAPFFSIDAMNFLAEKNVRHLLTDTPSIDRLFDDGKLANHRVFWNVAAGRKAVDENTRVGSTITELIYVSDRIADGNYLLNLQIAPFATDAAPSRPILFALKETAN